MLNTKRGLAHDVLESPDGNLIKCEFVLVVNVNDCAVPMNAQGDDDTGAESELLRSPLPWAHLGVFVEVVDQLSLTGSHRNSRRPPPFIARF